MNLEMLEIMVQPLVVIGCLVFGYVLKQYIPLDSKHIPLILLALGVVFSFALQGYQGVEVTLIGGGLSGLVSTGFHQVFHQYIKGNKDDELRYNELNEGGE